MSNKSGTDDPQRDLTLLTETIVTVLQDALTAQTSSTWTHRSTPATEDTPLPSTSATVGLELESESGGELFLSVEAAYLAPLAQLLKEPPQDPNEAWLLVLNKAQSMLSTALSAFLGGGIVACRVQQGSPQHRLLTQFSLESSDDLQITVAVACDAACEQTLRLQAQGKPALDGKQPQATQKAPKIERVLDVPLSVTLRFGQRHLALREVLALGTGSLVELDTRVEEPVDLVLGERVIARGEVVVVDGNYGLRITEVVEGAARRIQRLHTPGVQGGEIAEAQAV